MTRGEEVVGWEVRRSRGCCRQGEKRKKWWRSARRREAANNACTGDRSRTALNHNGRTGG